MNTTELIEIARECCFSRQVVGDETVLITFRSEQLQQFAQRIEQPLLDRINRLVDKLNAKDTQIEQLREALQGFMWIIADSKGVAGYHLNGAIAEWGEFDEVDAATKVLEETK